VAKNESKCAYLPCVCVPPEGERYCRQFCKDAGSKKTEIGCDCGHPACTNEVLTGIDRLACQPYLCALLTSGASFPSRILDLAVCSFD
jgi:hypothetical protein